MSAAGKFREIITVYTPATAIEDGLGGFVPGAPTFPVTLPINFSGEAMTNYPAAVQMLAARESVINNKVVSRQPYKFTLRYTPTVTSADRLVWNGLEIAISSVVADARKTELVIIGYGNS